MKLELGQYLDDLRRRHGLASDAELCSRTGISPPHISRMRAGQKLMGPGTLLKIHEAFGDSLESIRELLVPDAFAPDALRNTAAEYVPRSANGPSQDDVLVFIRHRIEGQGRAPTLQEIADEFNFGSPNTAQSYVRRLAAAGRLREVPGKKRGIELIG